MSTTNFDWKDRARGHSTDDNHNRLRAMARSGGYVMVRHPRAMPFALTEKEWMRLPLFSSSTRAPGEDNSPGGDGGC